MSLRCTNCFEDLCPWDFLTDKDLKTIPFLWIIGDENFCQECYATEILKFPRHKKQRASRLQSRLNSCNQNVDSSKQSNATKEIISSLNTQVTTKDDEISILKERIQDLERQLRVKEIEINSKDEMLKRLKSKLDELCEHLEGKTRELKDAQEENEQLKKEIVHYAHSFQNEKREFTEIHKGIHAFLANSESMKFLQNIFNELDSDQIVIIKSEELDIENIQQSLEIQLKEISDAFLKNKIELLAQFCVKSIGACQDNLKKLEKSKMQVSEAMSINSGIFTEADIEKSLAPVIEKMLKEELMIEKWDGLKNKLDLFSH